MQYTYTILSTKFNVCYIGQTKKVKEHDSKLKHSDDNSH